MRCAESRRSASFNAAASDTTGNKAARTAYTKTFTVNNAGDTADANVGDGTCADSLGRCTLRAAIQETNWSHGSDLIEFNIPGSAPISIQLGSSLPTLNDKSGGTTIDGYTQPGSQVNTAQYGSNAIPGVSIQGTSNTPRSQIFYITSAGNTVRGFALSRAYRPIVIDGTSAHDNSIIGNWVGFTATGAIPSYQGHRRAVHAAGRFKQPSSARPPWPTATSSATRPRPSTCTARAPTATSSRTTSCA